MALESFIPRSSNLSGCSYDDTTQELVITFQSGDSYRYSSVPESVWHGLKHAPSAGSYFHRQVRDRYSYIQE